jgi:hypothetical protein
MLSTAFARAQASFDSEGGCLNVVDFSHGQKLGEYGDKCISASYLHEVFINERFAICGGIGYSHHSKYKFSAIPVFLSTHYFFLDKRFSPFVNLRFGGFGLFGENNVDTKEKYSLSSKKPDFNLFVSPGIGVKMHITPSIGILVSINDDAYLVNAFDTNKNDYKNKLIQDLGINIGLCFRIKGW